MDYNERYIIIVLLLELLLVIARFISRIIKYCNEQYITVLLTLDSICLAQRIAIITIPRRFHTDKKTALKILYDCQGTHTLGSLARVTPVAIAKIRHKTDSPTVQ